MRLGRSAAWLLLVVAGIGCDDAGSDGSLIQSIVPARAQAGSCVHVLGERFRPVLPPVDATTGDARAGDGGIDGGARDSGIRDAGPDASSPDASVRDGGSDGGVRDAGAADARPAPDASSELCFEGQAAPTGAFVSFGGRAARVLLWDDDRIVVEVPAGHGLTRVVVTSGGRQSNAFDFEILP